MIWWLIPKKVYASSDDDITNNKCRTTCGGPDNGGDDDWALINITATTSNHSQEAELDRSRETVMMTTTKMSFGSLTMKDTTITVLAQVHIGGIVADKMNGA